MTAAVYDITIEQGATFKLVLTWKDDAGALMDLTGYTARMQVRPSIADTNPPLLNLTTENGAITLGGATGLVTVIAAAALTTAITNKKGVYDLELVDATGFVTRLLQGAVAFNFEVTR
jgi:hypothetical protein